MDFDGVNAKREEVLRKYSDCLKFHRRYYIKGDGFSRHQTREYIEPADEHKNSDRKQFGSMEKLAIEEYLLEDVEPRNAYFTYGRTKIPS